MDYHMLTTVDNPYNPFNELDEWMVFDHSHGYYTLSLLARVAHSSSELSETDQDLAMEAAIDEIVNENVSGMHKKVKAPEGWKP